MITQIEISREAKQAAEDVIRKINFFLGLFCTLDKITDGPSYRLFTLNVFSPMGGVKLGFIEFQWFANGGIFPTYHGICKQEDFKKVIS